MKILQITASYKPAFIYGGPIQSVSKMCESIYTLLSNQDSLQVWTTTANGKDELNVAKNETVVVDGVPVLYFKRVTKDHSHLSPALLNALRKSLIGTPSEKEIVHIHAWWNMVSILSCLVAKYKKVPVLLSPRGMLTTYTFSNRNSLYKKVIHRIIGKSLLNYCHFHATSDKEKKDIQGILNPKSITVLPNMVELGESIYPASISQDVFKLLFLSRIEQKKGIEFLIEALASINFPWQLTLAGTGNTDYINSLKLHADNLGIEKNIVWTGTVTNEEKYKVMAAHDLLCLTSYDENFANVVVESLSQGTPVLLSENVGLANYVAENKFGWVCALQKNEIAQTLTQAYQSTETRHNIRENAPSAIRRDFDSTSLAKKYITLFEKILDGTL